MDKSTSTDITRKRCVRPTLSQFQVLLEEIEKRPVLRLGKLLPSYRVHDKVQAWDEVAQILNSVKFGSQKSGAKWKRTWQDWKLGVRSKVKNLASRGSGDEDDEGRHCFRPLSSLEKRVLSLIAPVVVTYNGQDAQAPPPPPAPSIIKIIKVEPVARVPQFVMHDPVDDELIHSLATSNQSAASADDELINSLTTSHQSAAADDELIHSFSASNQSAAAAAKDSPPQDTRGDPTEASPEAKRKKYDELDDYFSQFSSKSQSQQENVDAAFFQATATQSLATAVTELGAAFTEGASKIAAAIEKLAAAFEKNEK